MSLRKQKAGKQKPWKLEELQAGLENFFKEYERYPTATEFDKYPYLPSARSIERRFGGLIRLREQLGLDTQSDMRTGEHSSNRAKVINKRAHEVEQEVYTYLIKIFGKPFVHREYFFLDDKRTRADFFVYDTKEGFCVDVFYPSDKRNLVGCLNSKLKKYDGLNTEEYPVIFLQMNNDLTQETLNRVLKNKEKKLRKKQHLFNWEGFMAFCNTRNRRKET